MSNFNAFLIHSLSFSLFPCAVPSVAPVPTLSWLTATAMHVSWSPLSLEEARGFLTGYTVTYTSTAGDGGRRKRDDESGTRTVSADETSVTLSGLDSDRQYSVSVAASTSAGTGVPSAPITAPSESNFTIASSSRSVPSVSAATMYQ